MGSTSLILRSPAFVDGGNIPSKYTCDGAGDVSPPLSISGVPEGAKSLALIMDDPDIPEFAKKIHDIEAFDHWVLYNIPADTTEIPEGTAPGMQGLNTAGGAEYACPCPPQYEPKEHRYVFVLYALSDPLSFTKPPTKQELLDALEPMILTSAKLTGRYARK